MNHGIWGNHIPKVVGTPYVFSNSWVINGKYICGANTSRYIYILVKYGKSKCIGEMGKVPVCPVNCGFSTSPLLLSKMIGLVQRARVMLPRGLDCLKTGNTGENVISQ